MMIASKKISVIWFKKDLRLYDNEALSSAAEILENTFGLLKVTNTFSSSSSTFPRLICRMRDIKNVPRADT